MAKPKRPRDTNKLGKFIVDLSTCNTEEQPEDIKSPKNPHAVALGRLGGLKGGKARATNLSPERRKEIAKQAAKKRWNNK